MQHGNLSGTMNAVEDKQFDSGCSIQSAITVGSDNSNADKIEHSAVVTDAKVSNSSIDLSQDKITRTPIAVCVPPVEYLLGIADLTGELMRLAINSVGRDDGENLSSDVAQFIREIQTAFGNVPPSVNREIGHKLAVMRQSGRKVEAACYAIKVRGSEMPKHLLAGAINSAAPAGYDVGEEFQESVNY